MRKCGKRWRENLTSFSGLHKPDKSDERQRNKYRHTSEKGEGAKQDRLLFHPRLDLQRHPFDPLGERLLPDHDVAALDLSRWSVVVVDHAGEMQPHGDQFVPVPARLASRRAGGRLHLLAELESIVTLKITVGGPRERRRLAETADVRNVEPQVHVAAAFAARRGHAFNR